MIASVLKSAGNMWHYFRCNGLRKFLERLCGEIPYAHKRIQYWCKFHLTGRLIELCGNTWKLDGLHFSLNTPSMVTGLKGRFFWNMYERTERALIKKHISHDLPVVEGGASIGVVSCLTNSLLAHPKNHVVVEANPELVEILEENRNRNGCKFSIVCAALDASGPTTTFYVHEKSVGGSVQRKTNKQITVPAISIQSLLKKHRWEKITLIIDIEGGEIDLIRKESDILRKHVALLIVEMHPCMFTQEEIHEAFKCVKSLGFIERDRAKDVYVFYNQHLLHS